MNDRPPGLFEGTEMPTAGWWEALWPDPAGVLAAVGLRAGMEVIDLCAGDGWFTLPMARLARRVVAIDIDPTLLKMARHRLMEGGVTNFELVQGDAYQLAKLVAHPVDFVFMANAFHGVPDQVRLVRAIGSRLKAGGIFAVINWQPRPRGETIILGEPRGPKTELRMPPERTIESVQASGLKFLHLVDVSPHHYGAIFQRPLS